MISQACKEAPFLLTHLIDEVWVEEETEVVQVVGFMQGEIVVEVCFPLAWSDAITGRLENAGYPYVGYGWSETMQHLQVTKLPDTIPQTGLVRFYTQEGSYPDTVSQSIKRYGRHRYNFVWEGDSDDRTHPRTSL